MKTKTIGFIVGSLGLLVGVCSAHAQDQAADVTGGDAANVPAQSPTCRDMGVTVSFKTDSYELDRNGRGALDGGATWMKRPTARGRSISRGYADTTGNSEANLTLSQHRADSVKAYLVSQGIDPSRIITAGRGEIAEHQEHLPAEGRTVTFMGCKPAAPVAEAPAAEEPAPVAEVPPPPPAPEIYPVTPPPSAPEGATYAPYGSKFGWAFLAGGGFQDFTKNVMRAQTNTGGAWNLRLVGGTKSIVGFEAAYVGSARARSRRSASWPISRRSSRTAPRGPFAPQRALDHQRGRRSSSPTSSAAWAGPITASRTSTATRRSRRTLRRCG